jgi:hypothetical protein
MKTFEEKTRKFVELSQLTNPSPAQRTQWQKLRNELHARGLNPQDPQGIVDRAIIHDHRQEVAKYCELHERVSHADKCTAAKANELEALESALKAYGIQNMDRHYLERCLASFKVQKKRADKRKKSNRGTSPARQHADELRTTPVTRADIDDDVNAIMAPIAAAAKASAQKAAEDVVAEILDTAIANGNPVEVSQDEIAEIIEDALAWYFSN